MSYPLIMWKRYSQTPKRDAYGKEIASFDEPVAIEADFAPESTAEPLKGTTQRVVSEAKLFLRTPIDYTHKDEFIVDGVRYKAEGVLPGWHGRYSRRTLGQQILLKVVLG